MEMLSDASSTLAISTTTRPGIRKVFRAFVMVENKPFQGCHRFYIKTIEKMIYIFREKILHKKYNW